MKSRVARLHADARAQVAHEVWGNLIRHALLGNEPSLGLALGARFLAVEDFPLTQKAPGFPRRTERLGRLGATDSLHCEDENRAGRFVTRL